MSKRSLVPLLFLLLVSALMLSACGSSGGSDDEGQIEKAIETSATATDPADCTKYNTQAFMEQSTDASGAAAVKACEKEAGETQGKAESAEVSNISVEGSKATAEAAISGGGFDGQTIEVALVKENGQWKLDELVEFTKFDQPKLVEAVEEEFAKQGSGVSEEIASCVEEGLSKASQPKIEEFILGGSSQPIEELAESCNS